MLASAVGMDKAVMKVCFAARGLPMVAGTWSRSRAEWERAPGALASRVESTLGYPVFVKPANLGSSVGISKARDPAALGPALALAAEFDRKIVVEAAVPAAREIECSVLGNDAPRRRCRARSCRRASSTTTRPSTSRSRRR